MELYQKSISDSESLTEQFKHEVDDIKTSLQKTCNTNTAD